MNPDDLTKDEEVRIPVEKSMAGILGRFNESIMIRNRLQHRWTKNQKLVKGIPVYQERENSPVKKRPKIRFRKIWSNAIRILASLYRAFLQDKRKFRIRGFDEQRDFEKARILEIVTKYRLNWLFRRRDGFTKFIWAFLDCISPGASVVKMHWKYNEDMEIDEPAMTNYPLEQVALDWTAATVDDMRYVYLENYLTMDQLKEMGYNNLNKVVPTKLPYSSLRAVRFYEIGDPTRIKEGEVGSSYAQGTLGNHYPSPGTDIGSEKIKDQDTVDPRYLALECFYKHEGKIYFAVINPHSGQFLKKPMVSPYGKVYPIVVGTLLLEAHKLIPESVVEPLEGPQEDLNMTMNLRKENQLLAMMGGFSIDKFGGVDRQALSNLRPGFIVTRNSGQGVIEPLRLPDVTQSSYVEANADQLMIDEMSGVTPVKQGQATTSKTGVAQINLAESNAKEDLFVSTVSETLFKQIIYLLAYQIQLFESDETIFRVANEQLRKEGIDREMWDNIYDVEFDMDVEVDVRVSESSRAMELQRKFAFIDRALQANNATTLLLRSGIQVQNPQIVDVGQVLKDVAEDLEIDNYQDYLVQVQPPPQQPEQGQGTQAQVLEGQAAPQPNQAEPAAADFQQMLQQRLQQG